MTMVSAHNNKITIMMTTSVRRIAFILAEVHKLYQNKLHKANSTLSLSQRLTLTSVPKLGTTSLTGCIGFSIVRHGSLCRDQYPCYTCCYQREKVGHSQIKDALLRECVSVVVAVDDDGFVYVLASQQRGTLSRIQNAKAAENTRVWSICTFNCENQNKNTNNM